MHDVPMLADFAARLAFGLAILLLLTSWRNVPLAFFRTNCQIILALLVLAALACYRSHGSGSLTWFLVGAGFLAYLATVCWGLGLPVLGRQSTFAIAVAAAAWLLMVSASDHVTRFVLDTASRMTSSILLGSTLSAMLLGHHYLTAPTMSIEPLKRYVRCMGLFLGIRIVLAASVLILARMGSPGMTSVASGGDSLLFLGMRWGMGFAGPVLATWMAWKTVQIRSTQSATGILYVAVTLVLVGELSSMILAQGGAAIA